jgi:hypothetical protein
MKVTINGKPVEQADGEDESGNQIAVGNVVGGDLIQNKGK